MYKVIETEYTCQLPRAEITKSDFGSRLQLLQQLCQCVALKQLRKKEQVHTCIYADDAIRSHISDYTLRHRQEGISLPLFSRFYLPDKLCQPAAWQSFLTMPNFALLSKPGALLRKVPPVLRITFVCTLQSGFSFCSPFFITQLAAILMKVMGGSQP